MSFVVNANGFSAWSSTPVTAAAQKAPKQSAKASAAKGGPAQDKAAAPSGENKELEGKVLQYVGKNGSIENTENFVEELGISSAILDPVLKSLVSEDFLVLEVIEKKQIELTEEGKSYAKEGSPEFQFVSAMKMGEKADLSEMENRVGKQIAKIGFGKAMKEKWIKKDGGNFERVAENPVDKDKTQLNKFIEDPKFESHNKKDIDNYKKRKHLNVKSIKSYKVTKGANFALERTKLEAELTADMLRSGDWKDIKFKNYNFDAEGSAGMGGHCHPLMQVREQFKEIFLSMGF